MVEILFTNLLQFCLPQTSDFPSHVNKLKLFLPPSVSLTQANQNAIVDVPRYRFSTNASERKWMGYSLFRTSMVSRRQSYLKFNSIPIHLFLKPKTLAHFQMTY